jgi:DNA-nicking Smr family endonuclease
LLAAYTDVIPIADSGRVVLGQAPSRRVYASAQPASTDKTDLPAGEMPPVILPPDADLSDPATLFRHAARGARQIDDRNRVELPTIAPAPAPLKREADEREALNESLTAPLTFEDRLDMGDEAAFLRPGLPKRVLTDLRRGRWVLQGELDLHGLTRDEARDALAQFLAHSLQQGRRCIRVIHGKGLGSPGRVSILKQLSRGWLAQREEILAFCQAGPHDGGGGALLVLMRAPNGTRR